MAISMGGGKGVSVMSDINITPLTDVFLVLLIIFMVTAGLLMGARVGLPGMPQPGASQAQLEVFVTLSPEGKVFVNGEEVLRDSDMVNLIRQRLILSKDKLVVFNFAPQSKMGRAVELMDAANIAGAQKLAMFSPIDVGRAD